MLGIVVTVFAVLLSQRLGWDPGRGRLLLALAGIAFSLGVALPLCAVRASSTQTAQNMLAAGGIATGVGALLLVWGVLRFARRD